MTMFIFAFLRTQCDNYCTITIKFNVRVKVFEQNIKTLFLKRKHSAYLSLFRNVIPTGLELNSV